MDKTAKKEWVEQARWDAALDRMGRDAVIAKLGSHELRADSGSEFKLDLPDGGRHPKRRYVEEWLRRMAAKAEATEARRFWCIFVAAVLAAVVGIIAAWPVIHDWIR
jgi:hypothetical protein